MRTRMQTAMMMTMTHDDNDDDDVGAQDGLALIQTRSWPMDFHHCVQGLRSYLILIMDGSPSEHRKGQTAPGTLRSSGTALLLVSGQTHSTQKLCRQTFGATAPHLFHDDLQKQSRTAIAPTESMSASCNTRRRLSCPIVVVRVVGVGVVIVVFVVLWIPSDIWAHHRAAEVAPIEGADGSLSTQHVRRWSGQHQCSRLLRHQPQTVDHAH